MIQIIRISKAHESLSVLDIRGNKLSGAIVQRIKDWQGLSKEYLTVNI